MSEASPEIVELQPQEAIAVRGDVPMDQIGNFFDRAFGEAAEAAGALGLEIVGPPFGFYPEMPSETVAVEAGFPVSAPAGNHGSAHAMILPGGRAVQVVHVGPYEAMEETYGRLQSWMAEQGLEPASGMWEVYTTDPGAEPDPAKWQTLIVWPIA